MKEIQKNINEDGDMITTHEQNITLEILPKKIYKTQCEIYKELYEYALDFMIDDSQESFEIAQRAANIYAVQNTDSVWKEQYE